MTSQPAPAQPQDPFLPHDLGCQCWPHVSQRDAINAADAVALAEYRDGLHRSEAAQPQSSGALDQVLVELREEIEKARAKHAPMNSPHEGWAVILEELTPELWEHVCGDTGRSPEARHEALQVAAMGVRYILDLIDDPPALAAGQPSSGGEE